MAFSLLLNQRYYKREQLLRPNSAATGSAFEFAVLDFASRWLSGQDAFVVHTSGSTGEPKPIVISRRRMQASARLTLQALGIGAGTPALLCIHPNYIGGKMMLVRAMEGNLPLLAVEPSANPLKNLPAQFQPAFAAMVPLQLQAAVQDRESLAVLNRMQAVLIGGAAVSSALEEEVQQVMAPLYSTYGMTETVSHVALRRINGPEREAYFSVLPQIQIHADSRGCLVIEGPVTESPVVTNDVVEILGSGRFRWLGRADNIINSGGVKVQAEKVDEIASNCLKQLGLHRRVLAGGLPDETLGFKVALLLEGAAIDAQQREQLLACMRQRLPKYWAPKEILFVAAFVESDNGKIKRKESWAQLGI